jgi:hypothetical protein
MPVKPFNWKTGHGARTHPSRVADGAGPPRADRRPARRSTDCDVLVDPSATTRATWGGGSIAAITGSAWSEATSRSMSPTVSHTRSSDPGIGDAAHGWQCTKLLRRSDTPDSTSRFPISTNYERDASRDRQQISEFLQHPVTASLDRVVARPVTTLTTSLAGERGLTGVAWLRSRSLLSECSHHLRRLAPAFIGISLSR